MMQKGSFSLLWHNIIQLLIRKQHLDITAGQRGTNYNCFKKFGVILTVTMHHIFV